jgi:lipopolysaccharide export system permease protein
MIEIPNKNRGELSRLYYKRDRLRVKNVFGGFQESKPGTISKGDREMSVCEMQTMLQRADYQVRQSRHELKVVDLDRRGITGPRPEAPKPGEGIGLGKAYCQFLALFKVKEAEAVTQERAGFVRAWRDTTRRATGDTIVTAPDTQDDAMLNARAQDARFRLDESLRERNRYDVEIQKKFSLAAACMIFVLIGAPIALRFPRGGVGLVIGVSFAIFGLYYVGLIGGETLANKAYIPPWLAMWAVNILLLLAGLILASRMGRESSTARGGDFAELLLMTRTRFFGWLRSFGVPLERRRT